MHKNIHLQLLVDNNNQIQNLVKLNNSLIHIEDQPDIHYENCNAPHLLHKQFLISKNVHLQELVDNNNQLQSQNLVNLGNYLIHKQDHLDTHHEHHNLLHFLHKEFQMHKNLHLQELVDNNNQLLSQNQVKLDNCLIHKKDRLDSHHQHDNLLHFPNKCYNYRIQILHCLQ